MSHNPPPHLARLKAVEAAEKRARVSRVLGSGANRLGGTVTTKSPRELAAQAAERRARDDKSCGHGHSAGGLDVAKIESERAARDGIIHKAADLPLLRVNGDGVIDLASSSDEDDDIIVLSDAVSQLPLDPPHISHHHPPVQMVGMPRRGIALPMRSLRCVQRHYLLVHLTMHQLLSLCPLLIRARMNGAVPHARTLIRQCKPNARCVSPCGNRSSLKI